MKVRSSGLQQLRRSLVADRDTCWIAGQTFVFVSTACVPKRIIFRFNRAFHNLSGIFSALNTLCKHQKVALKARFAKSGSAHIAYV
jgi:hypothetical protein